jgi:hypothetical protein
MNIRFVACCYVAALVNLCLSACQPTKTFPADVIKETVDYATVVAPDKKLTIASVSSYGCNKGMPYKWSIPFHTAFGSHQLLADFQEHEKSGMAKLAIDGTVYNKAVNLPFDANTLKSICDQITDNQKQINLDRIDTTELQNLFSIISPGCTIATDAGTNLVCEYAHNSAQDASRTIKGIQEKLIKRWNRHPYLLARRIAITQQLATSVTANDPIEMIKMCRLVGQSLPDELPLAMRSGVWADLTCKQPASPPAAAHLIVLDAAIREIELLTKSLSSSSRLGYLTVKIDRSTTDVKDFWVTLKPVIVIEEDESGAPDHNALEAWHPLFNHASKATRLGMDLGIIASDKITDSKAEALDLSESAQQYLKHSVASETEFTVSNGRSKLLRLPIGTYTYTITPQKQSFPEFFEQIPEQPASSGTVDWTAKSPRASIRRL